MIHSTHTEFTASGPRTFPASRASHQTHSARESARVAPASWSPLTYAEPDISSLWDTGLLDRLSEPITRFHE
jgi:hypothetical protein